MRPRNQKLLDWLRVATDDEISKTGSTRSYLQAIAYGYKTAGAKVAAALELVTDRKVCRVDLRDDWAQVWPELVTNKAAA
jgi:hypothetical protein